jgi:uncharacterized protein
MARHTLSWQTIIVEPSKWLAYCFFQPSRFSREIEVQSRSVRLKRMLRIALPLFLYAYLPTLLLRLIFGFFLPRVYSNYYPKGDFAFDKIHLLPFLSDTIWACLLAIVAAIIGGALLRLSYGVAGGLAAVFWVGVVVRSGLGSPGYLVVAATVVMVVGLVIGVGIGSARDITKRSGLGTGLGSLLGLTVGLLCGFPIGLGTAYLEGIPLYHQLKNIPSLQRSVLSSTLATLLGTAVGVLVAGMIIGMIRGSLRARILNTSIERALSVGLATCIAVSAAIGGVMGTAYGAYGERGFALGLEHFIFPNILVAPLFIVCYMLGYYRLPLYPVSAISSLLAYRASKKNAQQAFERVQHSALYWDEGVFLPLPGLRKLLTLIASNSQTEQAAIEVITFIIAQRPSQMTEALPVLREMVINDLAARSTIQLIGQAFEYLAKLIPLEAMQVDPYWHGSLSRLEDASREAARFCTPMGRITRHDALNQMVYHLNRVRFGQLGDAVFERCLSTVVSAWQTVARDELSKLQLTPQEIGNIENPYICGLALQANAHQFVGRRDLVQQIERALNKGIYRPCFFLTGERRMGKTSTLNQLPLLLGTRYLPLVFDLQLRGISSSAAAFLSEMAEAISTVISTRGIPLKKLAYTELNEAQQENEAAAYRTFDIWLKQVEQVLEQEKRTILIAFDEFEKLEDARRQGYLNLNLLLDWFRSVIQNRSHLTFLFSGVKTLGDMEGDWSSYFVNVQTLRITFLAPADAFRLITQPTNDFPSEHLFGNGVVEEIMHVTGNHPFLIQCVCYEIIEMLNDEAREQAIIADVQKAVEDVFNHWQDTYFLDLWKRTTPEQRICLEILISLGSASLQQIADQCQLGEQAVRDVLQILRRRDLILFVDNVYQISAPIFEEWVKRSRSKTPLMSDIEA